MIRVPPIPFLSRRNPTAAAQAAPPALTLVSAECSEVSWVRLTFDRAIGISAIDVGQFTVYDDALRRVYLTGTGTPPLLANDTVDVFLAELESYLTIDISCDPAIAGMRRLQQLQTSC